MSEIVATLNFANYKSYAVEVYEVLKDKRFTVSSTTIFSPGDRVFPTGLECSTVKGALIAMDGRVSIPLLPIRTISWDINCEIVKVLIRDNGQVIISRIFDDNSKCITRHIIPCD